MAFAGHEKLYNMKQQRDQYLVDGFKRVYDIPIGGEMIHLVIAPFFGCPYGFNADKDLTKLGSYLSKYCRFS